MVVFCHHAHRQQLEQKERERGERVKPPSAPAYLHNEHSISKDTHVQHLFFPTRPEIKTLE